MQSDPPGFGLQAQVALSSSNLLFTGAIHIYLQPPCESQSITGIQRAAHKHTSLALLPQSQVNYCLYHHGSLLLGNITYSHLNKMIRERKGK